MEQYAKSLQDVDAALSRLNATLASYKISPKPSVQAQAPRTQSAPMDASRAAIAREYERLTADSSLPLPMRMPDLSERAVPALPREVLDLRSTQPPVPKIKKDQLSATCDAVAHINELRDEHPVCVPLYIVLGQKYLQLGYPDLASAEAYRALLLSDAVQEASDENHLDACEGVRDVIQQQPLVERISLLKTELHADLDARHRRFSEPNEEADVEVEVWLREHYLLPASDPQPCTMRMLQDSISSWIRPYVAKKLGLVRTDSDHPFQHVPRSAEGWKQLLAENGYADSTAWPDSGMVRREVYPWNDFEHDRLTELSNLNEMMTDVAPKLEVRAVQLPSFPRGYPYPKQEVVTQLGVFAKEDIAPGEVILEEITFLTANNKLLDALCDACSADLPDLGAEGAASITACPDCDAVFCSQMCYEAAMELYHPALCGMDVEAIAKDVPPAEAADSLYALLLLRTLAMAQTQDVHPLELNEVKYIWGDFHGLPFEKNWHPFRTTMTGVPTTLHAGFPRTLPFSFEHNVRLPFHMLEKMNIDIYANPQYDPWVLNSLYAKFRGTASARLSGLGGRAIRGPEVSAVHPMWCLANHSCDPNVGWEWGGSIDFTVMSPRIGWVAKDEGDGTAATNGQMVRRSQAGIKNGEEVLNHYCDVELPVKERRAWAKGALGGECVCERCVYEGGPAVVEKDGELDDSDSD
ncbi:hypothetical protein LTR36_002937 [Oleoguttula mirabilis]|uniref:SET domain-containing protein n=1 Tax=Oleoguttula mirabilis TaxID=1507867 RepID=A0AAV9JKS7_9PEZI|nr:hypothetical protein LTR36_002937 [Oleoguttula mirabilis]